MNFKMILKYVTKIVTKYLLPLRVRNGSTKFLYSPLKEECNKEFIATNF